MFDQISVIIPLAENETKQQNLLQDLDGLNFEIIEVCQGGRAKNMNIGANKATRDYLWFLHADSRVTKDNLEKLIQSLQFKPDALHYFDLLFNTDGPRWMAINTWGANLRSSVFRAPYGDQGFCMAKSTFEKAGRYDESLPSAEDLMLVWKAQQASIKLKRIRSPLLTSARKYQQKGWLYLTCVYQYSWIKMSLPEMYKLLKIRLGLIK